jgi:hypothetical protein
MVAERADLGIERSGIDQAAHVLLVHEYNTLKHINILLQFCGVSRASADD